MPRKRMIDPKYWTDDKVLKISIPSRLLFIGLWNFSDDLGIHRDDNFSIKAEIFPIDNIEVKEIEEYKMELINVGLVLSFTDDSNGDLLFMKNWFKYQYILKPTPSNYRLPETILQSLDKEDVVKYESRIDNY